MGLIQYRFLLKKKYYFDPISEVLFAQGAIAIDAIDAKDSPIFATNEISHPLWNNIIISTIFEKEDFIVELIREAIKQILGYIPTDSTNDLIEQDWQEKWRQETQPCKINSDLAIYPSHIPSPKSTQKIITLDPGLAFGTGSHPTTKMCLKWISQNNIDNFEIIDLGCGSGILGIAAILFNAKSVFAIDNDQQALLATKINCQKNNIPPNQIQTYLPDQFSSKEVDLIVANIYLNVLIDLKDVIQKSLKQSGKILLTGILLEQLGVIINKYDNFSIIEKHQDKEWAMVVAKKM